MPTIPASRRIHAQLSIGRPDGTTFVDVQEYLQRAEVEMGDVSAVGTGSGGADGVVRRGVFALHNDRAFVHTWPDTTAREETEVVGDEADVIGDETDGAEALINLLWNTEDVFTGASFSPRDQTSPFNLFGGVFAPLLKANSEVVFRAAAQGDQESGTTSIIGEAVGTGDGTTTVFPLARSLIVPGTVAVYLDAVLTLDYTVDLTAGTITFNTAPAVGVAITADYTYFVTLFVGLIDKPSTEGPTVTFSCRDLGKRLMYTYVLPDAQGNPQEYGDDTTPVPAETVIQQIIDANLPNDTPQLFTPAPSGFTCGRFAVEYQSVWDAIQGVAAQFGWFLGYRFDPATSQFRLTLLEPPRTKDASTADFRLDYVDDFYSNALEMTDEHVRTTVAVRFRDDATGERDIVVVRDQAAVDEWEERAMEIEEGDTSLIRDPTAATRLGDAALADTKDLVASSQLTAPFFPEADVFTGVVVADRRVSTTDDFFAVESVRHSFDFDAGSFRTEAVGQARVVGGRRRWRRMQTRPGSPSKPAHPPTQHAIPSAPTGLADVATGLEAVNQVSLAFVDLAWNPVVNTPCDEYHLQFRRTGTLNWETLRVPRGTVATPQRVRGLVANVDYDFRVTGISRAGVAGQAGGVLLVTTPRDQDPPATPTNFSVIAAIRAVHYSYDEVTDADLVHYRIFAALLEAQETGGTATSGTLGSLTDTTQSWSVDDWAGEYVVLTGGTGSGQVRQIESNTTDTLTPTHDFATAPDGTTTYEIYRVQVALAKTAKDTTPFVDDLIPTGLYRCWVEAVDTSDNISVPTDLDSVNAGRAQNTDIEPEYAEKDQAETITGQWDFDLNPTVQGNENWHSGNMPVRRFQVGSNVGSDLVVAPPPSLGIFYRFRVTLANGQSLVVKRARFNMISTGTALLRVDAETVGTPWVSSGANGEETPNATIRANNTGSSETLFCRVSASNPGGSNITVQQSAGCWIDLEIE